MLFELIYFILLKYNKTKINKFIICIYKWLAANKALFYLRLSKTCGNISVLKNFIQHIF